MSRACQNLIRSCPVKPLAPMRRCGPDGRKARLNKAHWQRRRSTRGTPLHGVAKPDVLALCKVTRSPRLNRPRCAPRCGVLPTYEGCTWPATGERLSHATMFGCASVPMEASTACRRPFTPSPPPCRRARSGSVPRGSRCPYSVARRLRSGGTRTPPGSSARC
jgi:hypothetical protein